MKDINGYVSSIEDDSLGILIILDNWVEVEDGDKVKVTFEYQIEAGPEGEFQFEEKELVGEVVSINKEASEVHVQFETEVPKQLAEYDNVELTKISEEGSQIE